AALIAEVLPELWDLDAEEGRQRLTELRRLTRGALAEMRTLLLELRPGALAELALSDLLRQLAEAIAGRARLEVRASVHGQPRGVPSEVHIVLYRLAQEALNNAVKHAQAHNVDLELSYLEDGVALRVSDDGCGFSYEPTVGAAGHFGLRIMRERAESINAAFQLETEPGAGTVVQVTWRETEDSAA
ncbi:MAG: sensor histidine kinase, partial [Chloroflexi bacterium]|nr:sensor histidine kinase [Chloroflexota bacterium]